PQRVDIFSGTVADNIGCGRDLAPAEIVEAAQQAGAHAFIARLSAGYDTLVGERGMRLSGGEKQRLSIARALLKEAPILILDEATSSVDAETEALIQEALARLTAGRTVLVIAHRLSTIQNADRIIVLEDGRISGMGTHDDLMAADGYYARMFRLQDSTRRWQVGAREPAGR
ncbi:MAG: ATP-binding cassette domain-containing protein, partial [Planctomycetes bacterium]|nr:ATP-binding cassette domain-containing protein [Planctomycetota bacterium]